MISKDAIKQLKDFSADLPDDFKGFDLTEKHPDFNLEQYGEMQIAYMTLLHLNTDTRANDILHAIMIINYYFKHTKNENSSLEEEFTTRVNKHLPDLLTSQQYQNLFTYYEGIDEQNQEKYPDNWYQAWQDKQIEQVFGDVAAVNSKHTISQDDLNFIRSYEIHPSDTLVKKHFKSREREMAISRFFFEFNESALTSMLQAVNQSNEKFQDIFVSFGNEIFTPRNREASVKKMIVFLNKKNPKDIIAGFEKFCEYFKEKEIFSQNLTGAIIKRAQEKKDPEFIFPVLNKLFGCQLAAPNYPFFNPLPTNPLKDFMSNFIKNHPDKIATFNPAQKNYFYQLAQVSQTLTEEAAAALGEDFIFIKPLEESSTISNFTTLLNYGKIKMLGGFSTRVKEEESTEKKMETFKISSPSLSNTNQ